MDIKSLPREIRQSPTSLLILLYLMEKGDSDSIGNIALQVGFTEAAISKSVEKLLKYGLVEKTFGKGNLGKRKTLIKVKNPI